MEALVGQTSLPGVRLPDLFLFWCLTVSAPTARPHSIATPSAKSENYRLVLATKWLGSIGPIYRVAFFIASGFEGFDMPWSNDDPRVAPRKRSSLALLGFAKALYDLLDYFALSQSHSPGKARP
ncbi:hypothetical protein [Caballeronia mineralivorans]|uniref:hypothetical protein n=1 Tax=Caballeronia mineralivorans TaxID=2010198 RepID=UPI00128B62F5|nr:hypothetical protein [Caballeronia mineralivorans]